MIHRRPTPADVYLDTSVILAASIADAPHSQASILFCEQLIAADSHVYFSELVRLELPQAFRRLATTRHNLPEPVRTHHCLDAWGTDASVRAAWLAFGLAQFDALLDRFNEVFELPWDLQLWQASVDIMGQYGLQMTDAAHVATAQAYGLRDFAAVDDDFRRITGLGFWLIRD